jgi:hypothetical protein
MKLPPLKQGCLLAIAPAKGDAKKEGDGAGLFRKEEAGNAFFIEELT